MTEYFLRKVIRVSCSKEHLHTWVKEFGAVEAAAAFVVDEASALFRTKKGIYCCFVCSVFFDCGKQLCSKEYVKVYVNATRELTVSISLFAFVMDLAFYQSTIAGTLCFKHQAGENEYIEIDRKSRTIAGPSGEVSR